MFIRASVILMLLASQSAFACLFHAAVPNSDTNIPQGADWTVLRALHHENSQMLTPITKLEGIAGFQRATWWLTLLTKDLESKGVAETYIYLADVGMWSYYQGSNSTRLSFEVEPKGDFPYLVLTQVTLSNIVSGNITFNQATDSRLIFSN
ncbi:hypothetical protein [Vibrio breoganii]|uniref:hypothetical protein n=1 Tax=Vibrio breoganii TaxID=553239 RepID=UPI000C846DE4|nr:hypothetical protein [Vibrio breoganii]PMK15897.1 hypothetical protein BCU06_12950 [Vibrio breoganii]